MLLPDQEEFFNFFGVTPPPGMSVDGAKRFKEAYLRDPARLARWQQRPGATPAAPTPAPVVIVPPMVMPRATAAAGSKPPAAPGASPVSQPFAFTGSGGEYFGIWIVNLLLTIVTFGIYSAWAKVRRLQYFYRHTELAGASFDYHGNGMAILKGRLIAIGLLLIYNVSFQFSATLGVVTLVFLAAAIPWLLRSSFRFRMRNSSYRGLRFRFAGSTAGAYWTFLLRPIVVVFTLYLATPWFHQRLKQYQHGNTSFGKAPFSFGAGVAPFYKEYLIVFALMLAVMFVPFGMMFGVFTQMAQVTQAAQEAGGGAAPDPRALMGTIFTAVVIMMLGMLMITPLFQARMQNLVWNNTALGPHRFQSAASVWRLFGIFVTNTLLIVLTFGLFTPWAAVRLARYKVEALTLAAAGDLDSFVADQEHEVAATGEETAEMFDIDIAL